MSRKRQHKDFTNSDNQNTDQSWSRAGAFALGAGLTIVGVGVAGAVIGHAKGFIGDDNDVADDDADLYSNPKRVKHLDPTKVINPEDKIQDEVLLKISEEIGSKWINVGIELGIKYHDLKNTIDDDPKIKHTLKPMEMLQTWKKMAGKSFTYETLAKALKKVGLRTCALKYCRL